MSNYNFSSTNSSNISINGNKLMVNGVLIEDFSEHESKNITIQVNGNCQSANNMSGDVNINGSCHGDIETMSGNVTCTEVSGNIRTMSGDVRVGK